MNQLQKRLYQNKLAKGFNVTDVYRDFCYAYGELADAMLYILGLAEILGFNMETELLNKMEINEKRQYIQKDGVNIRVGEDET